MKAFEDLTNEEIVELTPEDISRYVDWACASRGIPLLPPVPAMPTTAPIEGDVTLYKAADYHFKSEAHARKVMDLIRSLNPMGLNYVSTQAKSYERVISGPAYMPDSIDTIRVFSPERMAKVKADIELAAEAKEQYEEDKKKYDDIVRRRGDVEQPILAAVKRANAAIRQRKSYLEEFKRYLALAENNAQIATNFLRAAHPDAIDVIRELDDPLARQLFIEVELQQETVEV